MAKIDETLKERGSRYGTFAQQARIASNIRNAMADSGNWHLLADDQVEALLIIANKLGRILNGDPNYADNWHDIAGYAQLIADRLLPGTPEYEKSTPAPEFVWGVPAEEITDE